MCGFCSISYLERCVWSAGRAWIYGVCGRSFSTAVAYFVTTREGLTGNIFPHGYMGWLHEINNSDSSHELSSQFWGHNIAHGWVRKEENGARGVSVVAGFSVSIPSHSEGACFPSCFWELKIPSFSLTSFNWKVYFYSSYIVRKSWVNEPTSCITTFPITLLGGPFYFP